MQRLNFTSYFFLLITFNIFFNNNLFCNLQEQTISEINAVSKSITERIDTLENILKELENLYNLNNKEKYQSNNLLKKIKNIETKINSLEATYPEIKDNNLLKKISELTIILKIINSNQERKGCSKLTKTILAISVLAAATGTYIFYKNLN